MGSINQQNVKPSILIPYPGPCTKGTPCQDIFVYLRPESNGVLVESTLLKVIKNDPRYKISISLIYLANIPGAFIVRNNIVKEHYSLRNLFAEKGKACFTPDMREKFEDFFKKPFENARVVGSYEALDILGYSETQLFEHMVPEQDMTVINGQNIKRIDPIYVVNYDIPALLHKNYNEADVAVMIFRSMLTYTDFHILVDKMTAALIEARILPPDAPFSRVFHYSKGPFEQVLDAIGYLYNPDGSHAPLENINYCCYLAGRGIAMHQILSAIKHPIMRFRTPDGPMVEENLLNYTHNCTFEEAYEKFMSGMANAVI